ncbi:hypothetical protein AVEN_18740-1 [Araneus ventricosus]|uniref:Uncharacterized protein n=1 Tax=Araneus ventricosus TaxID=182803 RepID=A0A4Y2GK25_ARAVE|nr:hypothetical protein AVEN_18740-1 [Araneus ventricosus]
MYAAGDLICARCFVSERCGFSRRRVDGARRSAELEIELTREIPGETIPIEGNEHIGCFFPFPGMDGIPPVPPFSTCLYFSSRGEGSSSSAHSTTGMFG